MEVHKPSAAGRARLIRTGILRIDDGVPVSVGQRTALLLRIRERTLRHVDAQILRIDDAVLVAIAGRAAEAVRIGLLAARDIRADVVAIEHAAPVSVQWQRIHGCCHAVRVPRAAKGQKRGCVASVRAGQLDHAPVAPR